MQVSVQHCSSAKHIWSDLQQQFKQHNVSLIFQWIPILFRFNKNSC